MNKSKNTLISFSPIEFSAKKEQMLYLESLLSDKKEAKLMASLK